MVIDTHHHFWKYNPEEYGWINNEMSVIRRNFLPEDLKKVIDENGVDGVISVHARQTIEETKTLLKYAGENEFMKGVVGWLPLADKKFPEILDEFAINKSLKGLRHVVQGEPNPEFILGKAFNNGISSLKNYNLVFDILIYEHQLPNAIRFVDLHPNQQFVLDHIAKPKIRINEIEAWKRNIRELAKRENVVCKISGMVTEADYKCWTTEQLQPYFDVVLDAFGTNRLMFGSDWPVCLVATQYGSWLEMVKNRISKFSTEEQEKILYKNALKYYLLK
ncbi:MAG: amidohydrolase family protein [Draconibacterium sp.]